MQPLEHDPDIIKLNRHSSLHMVPDEIENIPLQTYWLPPCSVFAVFPSQSWSSHTDSCDVILLSQNLSTSTAEEAG